MAAPATVDLSAALGRELHDGLAVARRDHRTAVDIATGATVALHYDDCEHLAHDRRIEGVGLAVFDVLAMRAPLPRRRAGPPHGEEGVAATLGLGAIRAAEDQAAVPWRQVLGRSPERVRIELA